MFEVNGRIGRKCLDEVCLVFKRGEEYLDLLPRLETIRVRTQMDIIDALKEEGLG
jgi:hypothetical protein